LKAWAVLNDGVEMNDFGRLAIYETKVLARQFAERNLPEDEEYELIRVVITYER